MDQPIAVVDHQRQGAPWRPETSFTPWWWGELYNEKVLRILQPLQSASHQDKLAPHFCPVWPAASARFPKHRLRAHRTARKRWRKSSAVTLPSLRGCSKATKQVAHDHLGTAWPSLKSKRHLCQPSSISLGWMVNSPILTLYTPSWGFLLLC